MNVTELATALMRCPSVTPTTAGVYDVIEQFLVPLGFVAHRKSFGEGEHAVENLYLRLGAAQPNFCFAGHTDVVPVGDASQWRVPAFEPQVIDGELYGRGAEDMKGAIAAFMIAVREFVGTKFAGSISLLITQDEEGIAVHGTKPMLAWLTEQGEKIDACIVGEPTNPEVLGEMAKVGRRGSVSFVLSVAGVQGHVAYPERADSPVTRIIHMLHVLKTETLDDGTDFFPPSNLEVTTIDVGNPTVNMIPAKASAQFNVRFNDLHTSDSVEAWVRERVARYGEYTLTKRVTGESFITHDARLVNIVTDAVRDVTGRTPAMSTTGGTSDARFIKNYCPVIEFGTTGRTAHMVNERVEVKTLEGLAKIYQRMLAGYFTAKN